VAAPDVMTSSQHMMWMLDEFEVIHGSKWPGFITGKPVGMGGSSGRAEATGYGVVAVLRDALTQLGLEPKATRASIQGFGNVAQHAARRYVQLGGTLRRLRKKTCTTWVTSVPCSRGQPAGIPRAVGDVAAALE